MAEGPGIRVEADGPYRVTGGPPLAWTAQDETVYGEPVGWQPLDPIPTGPSYALCRCGRSATKPICDGSHEREPWDSAETADDGPRSARATTFVREGIVVTDDRSLCTHAGFCGDRFTNVWQMLGGTANPEIRERIRTMVELCPSGSLGHAPALDLDPVEPSFERSIAVDVDGPLLVRGGIPVESADGRRYEVRNRVTLCRCGHSRNKPFCDGSHKEFGLGDG